MYLYVLYRYYRIIIVSYFYVFFEILARDREKV